MIRARRGPTSPCGPSRLRKPARHLQLLFADRHTLGAVAEFFRQTHRVRQRSRRTRVARVVVSPLLTRLPRRVVSQRKLLAPSAAQAPGAPDPNLVVMTVGSRGVTAPQPASPISSSTRYKPIVGGALSVHGLAGPVSGNRAESNYDQPTRARVASVRHLHRHQPKPLQR